MRTCEERIIVLSAQSARAALTQAKQRGRAAAFRFRNNDGHAVRFEFVGVLDLLELGAECEPDEVWYDIKLRKLPMERAKTIVPAEASLNAIRHERGSTKKNRST